MKIYCPDRESFQKLFSIIETQNNPYVLISVDDTGVSEYAKALDYYPYQSMALYREDDQYIVEIEWKG